MAKCVVELEGFDVDLILTREFPWYREVAPSVEGLQLIRRPTFCVEPLGLACVCVYECVVCVYG